MAATNLTRWGMLAAALAAIAVAGLVGATGGLAFSPGGLSAASPEHEPMGGVTSHAELSAKCTACHVPPRDTGTMSQRCTACHADTRAEFGDTTKTHGSLARGERCIECHTEHRGPNGVLVRSAHDDKTFPLTGKHATTTCDGCHNGAVTMADFRRAPKTCIGCHEDKDEHRGTFGTDCASCHNTTSWKDATLRHEEFPLDHGTRGTTPCKTCHQTPTDYKQYTCYGCHEHDPARVQRQHDDEVRGRNLDDCLSCHRGGSKHGERGERGERRERGEGGERRRRGRDHDGGL